jgi:hypothetical protein
MPHSDYATQDEVAAWIGRTGGWIRQLRAGKVRTLVPLPEPDGIRSRGRRSGEYIPLWRRERLPEFEEWFRQHVRALADAEVAAMEDCVRRRRKQLDQEVRP